MTENGVTPTRRCLVIGLDGASLDLIQQFADKGALPNLQRLMREGRYSKLRSTIPPMSPSAWTSFMTGKLPSKHGIYDFTQRLAGTYRTHITSRTHEPTLWGLLSQHGKRVAVFNVPQTYPVETVHGSMVTGLGTPKGRPFAHPPQLQDELKRQGYVVDIDARYVRGQERAYLDEVWATTRRNADIVLAQLRSNAPAGDWDLGMLVLRLTDEVPHFFWRYMDKAHPDFEESAEFADAIERCYRLADDIVGDLLRMLAEQPARETTVVVMSDHGFGPLHRDVYLNEWLRREGLLTLRQRQSGGAAIGAALRKLGFTRTQVGRALSRIGLSSVRGFLRTALGEWATHLPNDQRLRLADIVDWRQTKAYSMGYMGQIFLNVAGREPEGIVQPGAEYEAVLAEVIDSLKRLIDPEDGKPIVDAVLRREEIDPHANLLQGPDLFVVMRDYTYITRESYEWRDDGLLVALPPTGENATHRVDGVLVMHGAGISRATGEQTAAHITDLAPTLLALLHCPPIGNMDGVVLNSWLADGITHDYDTGEPGAESTTLAMAAPALTPEDEAEVLERLKNLGYVD